MARYDYLQGPCPFLPSQGCQEPEVVVPSMTESGCQNRCDSECGSAPDDMMCYYPAGTEMDPYCEYFECAWYEYSVTTGKACPKQCPTYCMEGQTKCPGGVDPEVRSHPKSKPF